MKAKEERKKLRDLVDMKKRKSKTGLSCASTQPSIVSSPTEKVVIHKAKGKSVLKLASQPMEC